MRSCWSRRAIGLAMTALVAPLLVACGGSDDPAAEGTPTPKFSEAPSSSAATEEASASGSADHEPETPQQVARAFVMGIGTAINSGETGEFMQYATDACSNCEVVAENVANLHKNGRSARSQGWTVETLEKDAERGKLVFLSGDINAAKQELLRRDGSVYKRESAAVLRQELRLKEQGKSWVITGWNLEQ